MAPNDNDNLSASTGQRGPLTRLLQRAVEVRDDEVGVMLLSAGYFFFLLCGYYPLRALRETMGVESGVANLPLLWSGTLIAMLLINPIFSAIVARFPRRVFIPYVYRFFILNLVIFYALHKLLPQEHHVNIGRAFYIWLSVFNLFVISIGWGFMADIFTSAQGKRLFGFIAVGASLGGIIGSKLVIEFAEPLGPINLMVVSIVLLECSAQCVRPLNRIALKRRQLWHGGAAGRAKATTPDCDRPVGGSAWEGMRRVAASPYLLGICLFMFFLSLSGTFLYFVQAEIAAEIFDDREGRLTFFATIDFYTNIAAALIQAFVTGRLVKVLGIGVTLGLLPVIALVGFAVLGITLTNTGIGAAFGVIVVVQVCRRAGSYALARPAREVLYTVVSREEKYKSKSFIDTFVTRGSDQVNAWGYTGLMFVGLSAASIMFIAVPLSGVWFVLALALGARQKRLAKVPRCDTCGYDLRGGHDRCPECGTTV